jgi:hypothetical protein
MGDSEGRLYAADDIRPRSAALGYTALGIDYCDEYSNTRPLVGISIESFIVAATWPEAKIGETLRK